MSTVDKTRFIQNVAKWRQSTILISGDGKLIYFDPYQVRGEYHDADLIFITHPHPDHFSVNDIKRIMKPDTIIVVSADAVADAKAVGIKNIIPVIPNREYRVAGLRFQTTPAYNMNKPYHPKENNWVGYICQINKVTYYIAGDTDFIPEMKTVKADVVFLPVDGAYTMTPEEAAAAANYIKPAVAVPVHYNAIGKTDGFQDYQIFISLLDQNIFGTNIELHQ